MQILPHGESRASGKRAQITPRPPILGKFVTQLDDQRRTGGRIEAYTDYSLYGHVAYPKSFANDMLKWTFNFGGYGSYRLKVKRLTARYPSNRKRPDAEYIAELLERGQTSPLAPSIDSITIAARHPQNGAWPGWSSLTPGSSWAKHPAIADDVIGARVLLQRVVLPEFLPACFGLPLAIQRRRELR
jgi:hypothetical protein